MGLARALCLDERFAGMVLKFWLALMLAWTAIATFVLVPEQGVPPYWPPRRVPEVVSGVTHTRVNPLEPIEAALVVVVRNRDEYKKNLVKAAEVLGQCLTKGTCRWKVFLVDVGSEEPLRMPVEGMASVLPAGVDVDDLTRIVRYESDTWDFWDGLATGVAAAGGAQRIMYMDGCNYPDLEFPLPAYGLAKADYYFPNPDRWYSGNFIVHRKHIEELLAALPQALMADPTSFLGSDQVMIWYMNLKRAPHALRHLNHARANAAYSPRNMILWRASIMMLYEDGSETWDRRNYSAGFCRDKAPFCQPFLNWLVRQPFVFHVIDAFLRAQWAFVPVFWSANWFFSWQKSGAVSWGISVIGWGLVYHYSVCLIVRWWQTGQLRHSTAGLVIGGVGRKDKVKV